MNVIQYPHSSEIIVKMSTVNSNKTNEKFIKKVQHSLFLLAQKSIVLDSFSTKKKSGTYLNMCGSSVYSTVHRTNITNCYSLKHFFFHIRRVNNKNNRNDFSSRIKNNRVIGRGIQIKSRTAEFVHVKTDKEKYNQIKLY